MSAFDIVIFGATSFVGKLVVKHFLDVHGVGGKVSWAIAGRSKSKMTALRQSYGPAAEKVPILIADANSLTALKAMCLQTKVVITMAGPYVLYGENLLRACAETGTDYCDITGEVPWVAEMMKRYEEVAQQTGARIVNFCGFDSIPSDMGVHYLQREAQRRFGRPCTKVRLRVFHARGNPPGGTYATAMDAIGEASRSKAYRAALADPYLLCPPNHGFKVKQNEAYFPAYDPDFKQWSAAFVMAGINTRVVHRSHALLGKPYGDSFRYEEAILVGPSLIGRIAAYTVTGLMVGFVGLAAMAPTRSLLKRFVLPKPGEGSKLRSLAQCSFDVRLTGETDHNQQIQIRLKGQGDPACFATSRMIAESGMCLARDVAKADKPGGFWTTSSLFGDKLINRLHMHGQMKFEVLDHH
ncbi:MAG: saccharopine dehydrogenase NADP-binding domain-containing protein [Aquabacterium sp.]|nr:saccharopine dehydrogenase NADP-binding domain-containing protein [Aquabacterium sp.]